MIVPYFVVLFFVSGWGSISGHHIAGMEWVGFGRCPVFEIVRNNRHIECEQPSPLEWKEERNRIFELENTQTVGDYLQLEGVFRDSIRNFD